jgi:hypothetical protein
VGGSPPMGWRPGHQQEVQAAEQPEAGWDAVAGSAKRLASRFCQLKTGHCLIGQYLNWTKMSTHRSVPAVSVQTREHAFGNCPRWKAQQTVPWAEVRKEVGRGKGRFKFGTSRRWQVQPAALGLPLRHRCKEAGPSPG